LCASQENSKLGSMGVTIKFTIEGQTAIVCSDGCMKEAETESAKTIARLKMLKNKNPAPKEKAGVTP
ncbi:MAG: hypothetical protein WCN64_08085, partial [Planctomycetota bacterium]